VLCFVSVVALLVPYPAVQLRPVTSEFGQADDGAKHSCSCPGLWSESSLSGRCPPRPTRCIPNGSVHDQSHDSAIGLEGILALPYSLVIPGAILRAGTKTVLSFDSCFLSDVSPAKLSLKLDLVVEL